MGDLERYLRVVLADDEGRLYADLCRQAAGAVPALPRIPDEAWRKLHAQIGPLMEKAWH